MRTEIRDDTLRDKPSLYARIALGIEPHYWQALWMDCLAPTKVGCMGRSFGKTFAEAASLLWFGDCHDDTEQLIVSPTSDQTRTIMRYAEDMVDHGSLHIQGRVERIVKSPFPEIVFRNDSRAMARPAGNDGRNLRSLHPDVVRFDECAYIPTSVVTEVVPPMVATSPWQWTIAISTPWGKNHFFDLFQRSTPFDPKHPSTAPAVSFQLPSRFNPAISARWLAEQRAASTALAFRVEYEGEFIDDQNAVFPWSIVEPCLADDLPTTPIPGHRYVIGYDPAKYRDRSGVVVIDVTESPWNVAAVADIAGRDYLAQASHIERLAARYNRALVLLDATSHDQMLEHLRRSGIAAEGFKFTNESKQELVNGLVLTMEQRGVLIPRHPDLLDELKYYRYELTAAGNVKLGAAERHHDDLVTALALAVQHGKKERTFSPDDIAAALSDAAPPSWLFSEAS